MDNFLLKPQFSDLRALLGSTIAAKGAAVKVGSMFTGWGTLEMLLKVLKRKWDKQDPATNLEDWS